MNISLKIVVADTGEMVVDKQFKSEKSIEKLAKDIQNYKIPIVTPKLYEYLKSKLGKEDLSKVVKNITKEVSADIIGYVVPIVRILKSTKLGLIQTERPIEIILTYQFTERVVPGVVQGTPVELLTSVGVVMKTISVIANGFTLEEVAKIHKLLRDGVVTVYNNKVEIYKATHYAEKLIEKMEHHHRLEEGAEYVPIHEKARRERLYKWGKEHI